MDSIKLDERLTRLERENVRIRILIAVALALWVVSLLVGQGGEIPSSIAAQKFILVDEKGRECGALEGGENPQVSLRRFGGRMETVMRAGQLSIVDSRGPGGDSTLVSPGLLILATTGERRWDAETVVSSKSIAIRAATEQSRLIERDLGPMVEMGLGAFDLSSDLLVAPSPLIQVRDGRGTVRASLKCERTAEGVTGGDRAVLSVFNDEGGVLSRFPE